YGEKNLGDAYARVGGVMPEGHLGTSVDVLGDLDGDGRAELAVGAPEAGDVWLYYGGYIE
ncbi:MAG TPA: integrin alpha, partial [Myxococcota bacterium]|nr:integrin alpha [Myxococcota bacterium]